MLRLFVDMCVDVFSHIYADHLSVHQFTNQGFYRSDAVLIHFSPEPKKNCCSCYPQIW